MYGPDSLVRWLVSTIASGGTRPTSAGWPDPPPASAPQLTLTGVLSPSTTAVVAMMQGVELRPSDGSRPTSGWVEAQLTAVLMAASPA